VCVMSTNSAGSTSVAVCSTLAGAVHCPTIAPSAPAVVSLAAATAVPIGVEQSNGGPGRFISSAVGAASLAVAFLFL
jgi:hypothetical protein